MYEVKILTGTIDEKFITKYDLRIADAILYFYYECYLVCEVEWENFIELKALEDKVNEMKYFLCNDKKKFKS